MYEFVVVRMMNNCKNSFAVQIQVEPRLILLASSGRIKNKSPRMLHFGERNVSVIYCLLHTKRLLSAPVSLAAASNFGLATSAYVGLHLFIIALAQIFP